MLILAEQFNESVLHILAFETIKDPRTQGQKQCYRQRHYLVCIETCEVSKPWPNLCYMPRCRGSKQFGNQFYCRIRLQARIHYHHDANDFLRGLYAKCKSALQLFRVRLSQSHMTLADIETFLLGKNLLPVSSNSILNDLSSIVLCETLITLHRAHAQGDMDDTGPLLYLQNLDTDYCISLMWCYLGHLELSNLSANTGSYALSMSPFSNMLALAAMSGHEAVVRRLLQMVPAEGMYSDTAIRGACSSGSMSILQLLLSVVSTREFRYNHSGWFEELQEPQKHGHVLEEVVRRTELSHTTEPFLIQVLATLTRAGCDRGICELLDRTHNRRLYPSARSSRMDPDLYTIANSSIWIACQEANYSCFMVLLDNGYLRHTSEALKKQLYEWCLLPAAHSNSLLICKELCRLLGRSLEDLDLYELAAMDGTIHAMMTKLKSNPDLLKRCRGPGYTPTTEGEFALKRSAERLRVANVAFLLDKGVRTRGDASWNYFELEWRYRRLHEDDFNRVQRLLKEYGCKQMQIADWIRD